MPKCLYKDLVLVLIYASQGKWSWYQIERALDLRGLGGRINSAKIANTLIDAGLIVERKVSETNLPNYQVTNEGEDRVRHLITEYGVEIFAPKMQNPEDFR